VLGFRTFKRSCICAEGISQKKTDGIERRNLRRLIRAVIRGRGWLTVSVSMVEMKLLEEG